MYIPLRPLYWLLEPQRKINLCQSSRLATRALVAPQPHDVLASSTMSGICHSSLRVERMRGEGSSRGPWRLLQRPQPMRWQGRYFLSCPLQKFMVGYITLQGWVVVSTLFCQFGNGASIWWTTTFTWSTYMKWCLKEWTWKYELANYSGNDSRDGYGNHAQPVGQSKIGTLACFFLESTHHIYHSLNILSG
jgi:hypothetical protein